jgi:hypothetical protein
LDKLQKLHKLRNTAEEKMLKRRDSFFFQGNKTRHGFWKTDPAETLINNVKWAFLPHPLAFR